MSIELKSTNFKAEVLDRSDGVAVLVDFWAEWCGPCRMLTPVLEKLESEFSGQFILGKINTDSEQELAASFQISGIPAVKLFINGQIVDEFTGALPEPQVRNFLKKNLPNEELEAIVNESGASAVEAARQIIARNIKDDKSEELLWAGALELVAEGDFSAELTTFLEAIPDVGGRFSDGRNRLLEFLNNNSEGDVRKKLSELFQGEKARSALDYFFNRVLNGSDQTAHRSDLLCCFFLLGNTGELVDEYRRKLSREIF